MGGFGSTRWRGYQAAALVEDTPLKSIEDCWGSSGRAAFVDLAAVDRAGEILCLQRFQLVRLPLARGGFCWRLVCGDCGRNVRFVYFIETDGRICCRTCGGLLHRSTRTSHDWGFEKIFRQICPKGLTLRAFNQHLKRRR